MTPTTQQRDYALERLRLVSAPQTIRDAELHRLLAPFRGQPPTALMCGNATCTRPFLWCALDPAIARVRFAGHDVDPEPSRAAPAPFDRWQPDEAAGAVVAQPGEAMLRWRFYCPRCNRATLLTNDRLILLILRALTTGSNEITPAAEE